MRLRVMAYNVHGFRAGVREVAAAVDGESPDVVLLNETRSLGLRLRRFARRMGLERAAGTRLVRPIPNAVLARPPWRVVRSEVVVLPRVRRTLRRGVVTAVIGRAGTRITVAAVHLGLSEDERAEHARALTDLLAGRRERTILGGDLNEEPDGRAATWIAERYWDAFARVGQGPGHTFPSVEPHARIDYLFISDGLTAERAWVGGDAFAGLSDHRPILADLLLE